MFKYRFFQVILAIAVVMLIVSSAVFISFQGVNISEAEYTSEMTGRTFETDGADGSETALTQFEAWLEYSIIADGLKETGNNVDFDKGNVKLYDYNLTQLRQLKKVKDEAKRMMFLSVILLIIGFLAVKKRRMYECVVWGGVAASVIGMVSLILLAVSGSGIFYGVREMVFKGRYDVFFSGDDRLISLIPDNLGLRMFLIYTGVILAGLVITIIVRLISWRKTQPHKF